MAERLSYVMKEIIGFIRELFAILHYFSEVRAVISIYNLIFESGTLGIILIWLVIEV